MKWQKRTILGIEEEAASVQVGPVGQRRTHEATVSKCGDDIITYVVENRDSSSEHTIWPESTPKTVLGAKRWASGVLSGLR